MFGILTCLAKIHTPSIPKHTVRWLITCWVKYFCLALHVKVSHAFIRPNHRAPCSLHVPRPGNLPFLFTNCTTAKWKQPACECSPPRQDILIGSVPIRLGGTSYSPFLLQHSDFTSVRLSLLIPAHHIRCLLPQIPESRVSSLATPSR